MRKVEGLLVLLLSIAGAACPDFSSLPCAKDDNCPTGFVCSCDAVCVVATDRNKGCSASDGGAGGGATSGGSAGGVTAGGAAAGGTTGGGAAAGGAAAGGVTGGGMAAGGAAAGGDSGGGATGGGVAGGGVAGGGVAGGGVAGGGVAGGGVAGGGGVTGGGGATGGSGGSGGAGGSGGSGGSGLSGDNCGSPIPLTFTGSTTTSGTLLGLSNDNTVCGGQGPDAVYQLTVSSPVRLTVDAAGVGFTPRVSVRSSCTGTAPLLCNMAVGPATTGPLAAGTYFVWVDSALVTGSYSLTISASAADAGVGTVSTFTVNVGSQTVSVDQYVPAGPRPFPVIALGHGFSLGKGSLATLATTLRDDGFTVVVPQFPSFSTNSALHAQMMLASVDMAVDAGVANPNTLGFGGHSAGALSAWLASTLRPTRAVALLDPIEDTMNSGLNVAGSVSAPALWVFAPPSTMCNSNNNAAPWFAQKLGRKTRFTVVGATSCDAADPVPSGCSVSCGGPTPSRAAVFRRYARAHFGRELLGPTLFPCVDPMVVNDVDAGIVSTETLGLGCP